MRPSVQYAVLSMYEMLGDAEVRQSQRGGHDQGARAQVTAGTHLNPLADVICNDLIDSGYDPEQVYSANRGLTLPGWFRRSKDWDILAFEGDDLLAAIELKSINSSFGNNANNRAEEAIGNAIDADYAIRKRLIAYQTTPPVLGFLMVIKDCDASRNRGKRCNAIYPIDEVFEDTSYIERLTILCRRLMAERIYQAVCVLWFDDETGLLREPDPYLSYDRFIETIVSQLRIYRA